MTAMQEAFSRVGLMTRGGRVGSALCEASGGRRLKEMLAEIGVRGERYSLQSLRKGRAVGDVVPAQRVATVTAAKQPAGAPMATIAAIWAAEDAEPPQ